jgi:hypothetical protein
MRVVAEQEGRIYECWFGRQRVAGKTTALRARVRWLARHTSVQSVWVLDRGREWGRPENIRRLKVASVALYRSFSDYHADGEIPRVVLWQLGPRAESYTRVLSEAASLGDVAIVIDEAYEFAEAGSTWTGSEILRSIVFAGAHLERREDGEMRPCHLIVAAQYPKSIHYAIWQQAYTVMVGQLAGKSSFTWIRDNHGEEMEERARKLKPFEWLMVHGRQRPELPGYGKKG